MSMPHRRAFWSFSDAQKHTRRRDETSDGRDQILLSAPMQEASTTVGAVYGFPEVPEGGIADEQGEAGGGYTPSA